ncbi:MAG: helix-turn-helix domain-containing protein [Bacillota bacterium]
MRSNPDKKNEFKEGVQLSLFFMGIGDAVYKARNSMKLSQEDLAEKTATTQRIISQIENADSYNMGAKMLFKLFKFLNIQMIIDGFDAITGREVKITDLQVLSGVSTPNNQRAFCVEVKDFYHKPQYSLNCN